MSRTFDGTDDSIKLAIGGGNFTGAFTLAAILRRTGEAGYHSPLGLVDSADGTNSLEMVFASSGDGRVFYLIVDATFINAPTLTLGTADGWCLVAAGKNAGSATLRFHRYVYSSNTWTHESSSGSVGDHAAPGSGGFVLLGRKAASARFWPGEILVAGVWDQNLADAQVEPLAWSWRQWLSTAPVGGWLLDQSLTTQNVADWTGNGANQNTLTGTTVSTSHPPIWNRGHRLLTVTRDTGVVVTPGPPWQRRLRLVPGGAGPVQQPLFVPPRPLW